MRRRCWFASCVSGNLICGVCARYFHLRNHLRDLYVACCCHRSLDLMMRVVDAYILFACFMCECRVWCNQVRLVLLRFVRVRSVCLLTEFVK